jgi:hypothetical protein
MTQTTDDEAKWLMSALIAGANKPGDRRHWMCKTEGCGRVALSIANPTYCRRCTARLAAYGTTTLAKRPANKRAAFSLWGANLDRLRKAKGVTVRQLCKDTGIDSFTYSRALRADSNVSIKYLVWLAEYFEVELYELFLPVENKDEVS